tara:strand:- start:77 stop:256 length:180 start_codon:yes stop_codon:yes gene_type:complete
VVNVTPVKTRLLTTMKANGVIFQSSSATKVTIVIQDNTIPEIIVILTPNKPMSLRGIEE